VLAEIFHIDREVDQSDSRHWNSTWCRLSVWYLAFNPNQVRPVRRRSVHFLRGRASGYGVLHDLPESFPGIFHTGTSMAKLGLDHGYNDINDKLLLAFV